MTLLAGVAIGVGALGCLLANALMPDMIGRLVGACLFTFGLLAVVAFELKLFTGMVAFSATMGVKNLWQLPICFVGNTIGILLISVLARFTFIGDLVAGQAGAMMSAKLIDELWYIKDFCSAIFCGILITFSVRAVKSAPKKGLSATVGVALPVIVFAFCGFDHSVANMLYFFFMGQISWQIVVYILITILGNFVGGVIYPIVLLVKERFFTDKQDGAETVTSEGINDTASDAVGDGASEKKE